MTTTLIRPINYSSQMSKLWVGKDFYFNCKRLLFGQEKCLKTTWNLFWVESHQKHTPHLRPAKKCYGRDVIVQMAFKVLFTFEVVFTFSVFEWTLHGFLLWMCQKSWFCLQNCPLTCCICSIEAWYKLYLIFTSITAKVIVCSLTFKSFLGICELTWSYVFKMLACSFNSFEMCYSFITFFDDRFVS